MYIKIRLCFRFVHHFVILKFTKKNDFFQLLLVYLVFEENLVILMNLVILPNLSIQVDLVILVDLVTVMILVNLAILVI